MSNPNRGRKQASALTTVLAAIIVLSVFAYRYLTTGEIGEVIPPQPATPVMVDTPLAAAESTPPPAVQPDTPPAQSADFDFYVLSLSWSPDYCNSNGNKDPQQCSPGKKLGFVLHGLWPQYNQGYPSNCSTQKLPEDVKRQFQGLYPSPKLYDHEWDKHGTCSGLPPAQYLALSKRLKESVVIPAAYQAPAQPVRVTPGQFKSDFVAANPALNQSSLAVYCSGSGRFLTELYVCFSVDGSPVPCSAEVLNKAAKSCRNPDFLVRNVK